jgi:hypothetical protein
MTPEQISFTMSTLRDAYLIFQQTQTFKLTPENNVKLQALYTDVMGRPLPNCSSCVMEGVLSLLIKAESELNAAQISDDEQKPKRRRSK